MKIEQEIARSTTRQPIITVDHLPSRSNQRDQIYFYTPYGTYIVEDRDGMPSGLYLAPGHWDEDSTHQGKSLDADAERLGTYVDYHEAQRHMLIDLVRLFRVMPPTVDPRLAPQIDADEAMDPQFLIS